MLQTPFISVEGPIGVGKTSLANRIANHFQFTLLKEIVEENPFLGKFYENIDEWSFQTEMFFLCNRYKQLNDIKQNYISKKLPVVADYHIFKNMIFTQRTLHGEQFEKYRAIYDILIQDMPKPNLVIYLNASLNTLLERIESRGRDIEKSIEPGYLERLSEDYETFMNEFELFHPEVPVIRLDGDNLDFVKNSYDLEVVLKKIEEQLQQGGYRYEFA
ncbi:MAG: deoxynucleoside kinase [Bacillales bacterium]|jgi:deoxyguanosine kinase|nr:deoxynucleoside kinase [Bacillales bacterium]